MNAEALRAWGISTGIKAVKTFAQTLAALIGAEAFNVLSLPWGDYLAVSAGAGIACVLHNVTSLPGPDAEPVALPEPGTKPKRLKS